MPGGALKGTGLTGKRCWLIIRNPARQDSEAILHFMPAAPSSLQVPPVDGEQASCRTHHLLSGRPRR